MALLDDLRRLWTQPFPTVAEAVAAFRQTYADPVDVNGSSVPVVELAARAEALQRAFEDLRIDPIQQLETEQYVVIAFWQRGRHVGPLETPLGVVAPTERTFEIRVIDVLSLGDGRITGIQVVPDNLALLMQLDALRLEAAATG